MREAFIAVGEDLGRLLYLLARSTRAKTIVEFGTSFGLSTIYLAAALRDNGGGTIITASWSRPSRSARRRTWPRPAWTRWSSSGSVTRWSC